MGKKERKGHKEAVENLLTGKVKLVSFSDLLREVWQGEEPPKTGRRSLRFVLP